MTLLVTCSGISNTGRLTTQAAQYLLLKDSGRFTWVPVQRSPEVLRNLISDEAGALVLNGCSDCCATKKLREHGLYQGTELKVTDLGILKKGMAEVQYDEIEIVVSAIREILQKERRNDS